MKFTIVAALFDRTSGTTPLPTPSTKVWVTGWCCRSPGGPHEPQQRLATVHNLEPEILRDASKLAGSTLSTWPRIS